ncbi:DUF1656 domain-containing protein [Coralloluteibacterium stylophorae]|uniref:DUF1656 domain-containing protein n=1 Tax=Coralloluteibacterium stylophorae TaxID=1776034 RepID=A0A8J8AYS2_9GAMM|nr:DUF1656 domain-containing protein [Coralloluteibacterium stylophorae]MBS7459033.1 DUF1656 domain-containing protein [Coralloluteibacterium stylophorae]
MPSEVAIGGVYLPGLLVVTGLLLAAFWLFDGLAGRLGLYRHVWHPPLFRLALFVIALGLAGLTLLH